LRRPTFLSQWRSTILHIVSEKYIFIYPNICPCCLEIQCPCLWTQVVSSQSTYPGARVYVTCPDGQLFETTGLSGMTSQCTVFGLWRPPVPWCRGRTISIIRSCSSIKCLLNQIHFSMVCFEWNATGWYKHWHILFA